MGLTRQLASLPQCLEYSTLLQRFYNTQVTADAPWKFQAINPRGVQAHHLGAFIHSVQSSCTNPSVACLVRNSASETEVYATLNALYVCVFLD